MNRRLIGFDDLLESLDHLLLRQPIPIRKPSFLNLLVFTILYRIHFFLFRCPFKSTLWIWYIYANEERENCANGQRVMNECIICLPRRVNCASVVRLFSYFCGGTMDACMAWQFNFIYFSSFFQYIKQSVPRTLLGWIKGISSRGKFSRQKYTLTIVSPHVQCVTASQMLNFINIYKRRTSNNFST